MRLAVGMRVHLLGTGSRDGWPNPWCRCASGSAAAADGVLRGQSSALVDGTALLAIHLGHGNPSPAELDAVLAGWGGRAPRDGNVLEVVR